MFSLLCDRFPWHLVKETLAIPSGKKKGTLWVWQSLTFDPAPCSGQTSNLSSAFWFMNKTSQRQRDPPRLRSWINACKEKNETMLNIRTAVWIFLQNKTKSQKSHNSCAGLFYLIFCPLSRPALQGESDAHEVVLITLPCFKVNSLHLNIHVAGLHGAVSLRRPRANVMTCFKH